MNKELILKAFADLPKEINKAEIALESHKTYQFEINNKVFSNINYALNEEYFVVVSGQKDGYYYTQDGNEEPLNMFKKAYANSLVASYDSTTIYNHKNHYESSGQPLASLAILKEKALNIYARMNELIVEGHLNIELIVQETRMATMNNLGLDVSYTFPTYILIAYLNGKDDNYPISVRNDIVLDNLEQDLSSFVEDMKLRYVYQKKPLKHFTNGQYRVLLDQNFVYVILCTAWQLFSGKKYLEQATCYKNKLGQKITNELLSFYDDNEVGYRFAYDCEGTCCQPSIIIDKGVYVKPLLNNNSSHDLKLENNGCAGRKPLLFGNIATDIQITPRNFIMKAGNKSFEQLLKQLNNGILITEHFDIFHSLDIASGELAIPCYGVLVKDGELVGNLRSLVVTGNIQDLFNDIEALSNRQTLRPMHYLNNYGIGACDLLVKNMMVSGE